jgi:hypothetical protein
MTNVTIMRFPDRSLRLLGQIAYEYGGVRPARTQLRKRVIADLIDRGFIEKHLLDGVHPLTLSGLKVYVTSGYGPAKYAHAKAPHLRAHNAALEAQIKLRSVKLSVDRMEFLNWCLENGVCAQQAMAEASEFIDLLAKRDLPAQQKAVRWGAYWVHEDDLVLVQLKWS